MTGVRLRLFGPCRVDGPTGVPLPIRSRRGVGLLACLDLANDKSVAREQICALLWPDRQPQQARASLRQLLVDLRQELGSVSSILTVAPDGAIGCGGKGVESDVRDFLRLSRADDRQSLEEAVAARRGPLVEGLDLPESSAADWLDDNRRRLDNLWCEVAARLLGMLEREGSFRECLELSEKLLAVDPLCEAAHQSVIRSHLSMNNRSFALRHFREFRELLDRELGVAPDPATAELLDAISSPEAGAIKSAPPHTSKPRRYPKTSIAVLPFEVRGGDVDDLPIADGLAEDLNHGLSRFADLSVMAQPSVRELGQSQDARLRRLGVDYVVQGTIRQAKGRTRITVSLVHSADGALVWSEQFDRERQDVFALQDEIVRRLVAQLAHRVQNFEVGKALQKPLVEHGAYELFLRARFLQQNESRDGVLAARSLLQDALARDPGFASAYAELSLGFVAEQQGDWSTDFDSAGRQAIALAEQAVAIDPSSSNSHLALAAAEFYCNRNIAAARAHADLALELNPNDQHSLCLLGFALMCNGRVSEAQSYSIESLGLSPLAPGPCLYSIALGTFLQGNYAEAAAAFARMPTSYSHEVVACLAACLCKLGQHDVARATMQRYMDLKRQTMRQYPGEDASLWRAYLLRKIPIADTSSAETILEGFRSSGLPV